MQFQYELNKKITITGNADDMKQFIRGMAFLEELPDACPICGEPVHFFFRNPKNFEYYGLKCTGSPAHETNFGQKKDGGNLFYKGNWEKEYTGEGESQSTQSETSDNSTNDGPPPPGDSDMPF